MRAVALAALLGAAFPGSSAAQGEAPLLKTDLIALLSSPVIAAQEIATLVRRNCLAFRPTDRDVADIKRLGASPDIVASIVGCTRRPSKPAAASVTAAPAAASLQVLLRRPRLVAAAGSQARAIVLAARAGLPQAGVPLTLRGTAKMAGGTDGDRVAVTDDSGFAVFAFPVGRRLGTYRLEVAPASGGSLPGRPIIEVAVRPGPAASAYVEPTEVVFDQGLDSIVPVDVTVRDSLGHPVAVEPVALEGDTVQTDSLGRARLVVAGGGARRSGPVPITVRGRQFAVVNVVVGASLLETGTGFLPNETPRGIVHHILGTSLTFEARTRLGRPAAGRTVSFRAVNASVSPAVATTDSAGRALVQVTLGDRAGWAVIVARIDSLERMTSVRIEPGPPTTLELEFDGAAVNSRWVTVQADTTFTVRVRSRDAYGNPTGVPALARMLRETSFNSISIARLLSVQEEESAVALTFRATRPGRAIVKLRIEDIGASLSLEVARRP